MNWLMRYPWAPWSSITSKPALTALSEAAANASTVSLIWSVVISLTRGNESANGTGLGAHTLSGHPPSASVAT